MKKIYTLFVLLLTIQFSFAQYNITFKVDMNNYTESFTKVYVSGTGISQEADWCGSCTPLYDSNQDDVWEVTVSIPAGEIEYLFTIDNWGDKEVLSSELPCVKVTGSDVNRVYNVTEDATIPTVCWNSCEACPTSSINLSEGSGFKVFPNPSQGKLQYSLGIESFNKADLFIYNTIGKTVFYKALSRNETGGELNLSNLPRGVYFFKVQIKNGQIFNKKIIIK